MKEEKIKGKKYYIIERIPKKASSSIYTKVISWVDASNWLVKKANFYKAKTSIHKTINSTNFKKIGNSWYAGLTQVEDFDEKHKTRLELLDVKQNQGLSSSFFNKSILENPRRLNSYLK